MTSFPIGNDSEQPDSTKKFVNQLDLIQRLQQRHVWKEIRKKKKYANSFWSGVKAGKKKSWPLVRPLNVPEFPSPGQSCLLAGKDTIYHTVSLHNEFNPLVASLPAQQLRQLLYIYPNQRATLGFSALLHYPADNYWNECPEQSIFTK